MNIHEYIHLYINSEAKYRTKHIDYGWTDWRKLSPTRYQRLMIDIGVFQVEYAFRRLSDMSESEMIGLLQSMVPDDMEDKPTDDDYDLQIFHNDGGNLVDENVLIGAEYTCRCFIGQVTIKDCGTICAYDDDGTALELVNAPKAYHYLLQRGFWLFGDEAFESGEIIDQAKINY